jgi:ABC-type transport system involved in cytochrome bd biosynthesis fused ATPase/permease subunit
MEHSTAHGQSLGSERARTFASEEQQAHFIMAWRRFVFAIVGGLIIVVPMLMMAVGHATTKVLVVIPTSILLFAAGVALFAKAEPVSLLAATAAYAAVLVALIGIGGPATGGA